MGKREKMSSLSTLPAEPVEWWFRHKHNPTAPPVRVVARLWFEARAEASRLMGICPQELEVVQNDA